MSDPIMQADGNFFGFERIDPATGKVRRDQKVVRGNGALTLTDDRLTFVRAMPALTVEVPLRAITQVGHKRSHNGKSMGLPVLRISYENDEGEQVILGICVGRKAETEAWVQAIETRTR